MDGHNSSKTMKKYMRVSRYTFKPGNSKIAYAEGCKLTWSSRHFDVFSFLVICDFVLFCRVESARR